MYKIKVNICSVIILPFLLFVYVEYGNEASWLTLMQCGAVVSLQKTRIRKMELDKTVERKGLKRLEREQKKG